MKDKEYIVFDPRDFICSPFWTCPKCGATDSFGVLMICANHYVRRCKNCRFDDSFSLPKLNKKIVYIDQMAISNMMKALNPATNAYQKGIVDNFWFEMFEKLDTLVKLQVLICPDSCSHMDESILFAFYQPLKRMYELLSYGVSFYDSQTIKRFQIINHVEKYISGKSAEIDLDIHRIVHGNINDWQDKFIISVSSNIGEDLIDGISEHRGKVHEQFVKISEYWQSCKDKSFQDFFETETKAFGELNIQVYLRFNERIDYLAKNPDKIMSPLEFMPPDAVVLINEIASHFIKAGVSELEGLVQAFKYLTSPSMRDIPFIKISSMLYAALARKFVSGRKKPPNQGMFTDIETISLLLPYCDAMFIDNECHGYLQENPLKESINYNTRTFCQNTKEEFLEYLDKIYSDISPEHISKVQDVYGSDWPKPYTSLYMKPIL